MWRAFNPAKPLWVFLGKTVTGSSKAASATRSDVIRILRFLGWVLARGDEVRPMIERLLSGQSGLLDDTGRDYFAGRFSRLPQTAASAYADLCDLLFHGHGRLHVVYLTSGQGELHLRAADNDVFGVVNVGDSAALYKLLVENPDPDIDVDREMGFAARLFAEVDRPDSTVNVVIGARRFIAGWNSWRVSPNLQPATATQAAKGLAQFDDSPADSGAAVAKRCLVRTELATRKIERLHTRAGTGIGGHRPRSRHRIRGPLLAPGAKALGA